jgi:WxcM-like, C-terminal
MIWRELDNFSSSAVWLVFASKKYEEQDYLREYEKYLAYATN